MYSYPRFNGLDLRFVRIGGPGLGNLLLPWSRFIVKTKELNLKPINPTWPQIKWGTLMRRENDRRWYTSLFKTMPGSIEGFRKQYLLSTLPHVAEEDIPSLESRRPYPCVIVFRDHKNYFQDIIDKYQLVKEALEMITQSEHLEKRKCLPSPFIGVHVRLGDFPSAANQIEVLSGRINVRIPLAWYAHVLAQLKASACADWPVLIFSDGRNAELTPLLDLPNCRRISFGSSLADLWGLACSNVLIASGSTYSMWASFLGPHARNLAPWSVSSAFVYRSTECGNTIDRTRNATPKLSAPAIKHILKCGILHKNC